MTLTDDLVAARPLTAGAAAPTPEEIHALRLVAGGHAVGDIAIRGGRVVHVHTGEVRPADVVIHGRHIAGVVEPGRLAANREVDATGLIAAPTFIDAHFHPEYTMLTPGELARLVVPKGTTTLLADPVCIANVLGAAGMDYVAATTTPLRLFAQVSPDVPRRGRSGLNGAHVEQEEILRRLRLPSTVSLGESNPFNLDTLMAEALSVTLQAGKRATGHTARLSGEPLWAYTAGGVGDDHNAATLDEVIERLRLGMIVTLQAGSMTDYCEAILGRPELLGLGGRPPGVLRRRQARGGPGRLRPHRPPRPLGRAPRRRRRRGRPHGVAQRRRPLPHRPPRRRPHPEPAGRSAAAPRPRRVSSPSACGSTAWRWRATASPASPTPTWCPTAARHDRAPRAPPPASP